MKKTKRILALLMAAVLALGLAACGKKADEKVLNIFTWATYFPDDVLAEFTEQTGIKINYSVFQSNEEMLMKIQQGGDYDLVLASDYIIDIARSQDLLMKLDKSKIPNFKNINPAFQGKFYDENNEYTVPYSAGIPLIIYNPELVGDLEITGYEDLWNPALADSVVVMGDARNVIGITLKTMGKSFNETDPAVLDEAREKLLTLRPNIRALDYNTPYNLMLSGETSVGYMFTSQVLTVLNENPNFEVVFPKEGLGFGIDSCFIPAKAPHADNARRISPTRFIISAAIPPRRRTCPIRRSSSRMRRLQARNSLWMSVRQPIFITISGPNLSRADTPRKKGVPDGGAFFIVRDKL